MLFNSLEFILWFLPLTLFIWFQLGQRGYRQWAIGWLLFASLFFYGWWNPVNLPILLGSVGLNYWIGALLTHNSPRLSQKGLLVLGIVANLAVIGYFKYANFFIDSLNPIAGTDFTLGQIILPLGISFFTFQQIAYLVDAYRGEAKGYRFIDYTLFVAFFPQLIAGPIVHHKDLITQFKNKEIYQANAANLAIGITIFAIGLFKKVMFADGLSACANAVFDAVTNGTSPSFFEAWMGSLAYTLQLYFDFSGYSDMAIGIGQMFGILLPLNFNSPYKATSIVDFWNRWHITLSRFLRDYLYIPLGGNRRGEMRRSINLFITMLLAGLWHGAGWTFVFWGGLHGVYLIINHQWRSFRQRVLHHDLSQRPCWESLLGGCITFLAVVFGWVFFRANDMSTAFTVLDGMIGLNGFSLPEEWSTTFSFLNEWNVQFNGLMPQIEINTGGINDVELSPSTWLRNIALLLLFVWFMPNTQEIFSEHQPILNYKKVKQRIGMLKQPNNDKKRVVQWQPNQGWAILCAGLTAIALLHLTRVSQFLYFEF
ncbi:membrane-bound O-acyltransferase family protein [filamentous cyanobacterium CCP2]|nr:membrane-bound O-acyltransferase family protein [filamentous cyanobacterium CCP2]